MNCEEARERIGAEPHAVARELLEHLSGCADCRELRRQMLELDEKIDRALRLDRPVVTTRERPVRQVRKPGFVARSRWAIAASLAAAFLAGLTLWAVGSGESLASDVVAHMAGEPNSWNSTERVSDSALQAVLRRSGITLHSEVGPIVYAHSCWFRWHRVPHLVVRTDSGPVTIMILSAEHVSKTERFEEEGYSGMLVPAPHGSIAVLSQGAAHLDGPAEQVLRALQAQNDNGTET